MAFFNLTNLGYQNAIRESLKNPEENPINVFESGLYRTPEKVHLPTDEDRKALPRASILPVNQTDSYGPGAQGSYDEFQRQRTKHIRNAQEPKEIFRYPITTSQEISNWSKDEPLAVKEPWTKTFRHVIVTSEMTKFVDNMALTNRQFSLF